MFWLKTEISEGVTFRAEITDENVFTTCPMCGVEHRVDLADIADAPGGLDLFGMSIYCAECAKKRADVQIPADE